MRFQLTISTLPLCLVFLLLPVGLLFSQTSDTSPLLHRSTPSPFAGPFNASLFPTSASVQNDPGTGNDNWIGGYGLPGTDATVKAIAYHNGKVYVGGEFARIMGLPFGGIALWDGTAWQALGDGPDNGVDGFVNAVAVDGDNVYVGGQFRRAGRTPARNIAVWNTTTKTWSALGEGIGGITASSVDALVVRDGVLYVGGRFVVAGTTVAVNIAQWDGSRWRRVGNGVNDYVRTLAVDDHYLYAGGEFTVAGDVRTSKLARFDLEAREWAGMDTRFEATDVITCIVTDEEYVYIGGRFDRIAGREMNNIARWKKSSGTWSDLKLGVTNLRKDEIFLLFYGVKPIKIHAMEMRGDDLFVGGDFDNVVSDPSQLGFSGYAGDNPRDMAKWNRVTGTWSKFPRTSALTGRTYETSGVVKGSLVVGTTADFGSISPRDDQSTVVYSFATAENGAIYIGGSFDFAGPIGIGDDIPSSQISPDDEAIFSANICLLSEKDTLWSPLGGSGFDNDVYALAEDGQYIYAAGLFTRAGAKPVNHIARLDKSTGHWTDMERGVKGKRTVQPGGGVGIEPSEVRAFVQQGEYLIAGGDFDTIGSVAAQGLAQWNKTAERWERIGNVDFDTVTSLAADDKILAVGGSHGLALWDGTSWSSPPNGPDGPIYAVALDSAYVYVGGEFTVAGGTQVNNVARLERATGRWSGFGLGTDGPVHAIAVGQDGLYIGGKFTLAGGTARRNIALWNRTSGTWKSLGSGIYSSQSPDNTVYVIHQARDGIYVGGTFQSYAVGGSVSRANNIIRWDGSAWRPLENGVASLQEGTPAVYALASKDSLLQVGGRFHYAGARPAARFAQWILSLPPGNDRRDDPNDLPSSAPSPDLVRNDPTANHPSQASAPDDVHWDDRFSPTQTPPGTDNEVLALAAYESDSDIEVYVGGTFTKVVGLEANGIAVWDGSDWEAIDDRGAIGVDGLVFALAVSGDDVYVGGQFSKAGTVEANNIAVWNRTSRTWRALGDGIEGDGINVPFVSEIMVDNGTVYVGGNFVKAGGKSAQSIARWNGTDWEPLGGGIEGVVSALQKIGDRIYAGGSFGKAGEAQTNSIAYWESGSWHGMNGGVTGVVNTLAEDRGDLVIGGKFTVNYFNDSVKNLAKWLTGVKEEFVPYLQQSAGISEVRDIYIDGPKIYVAGSYRYTPDPTPATQKISVGLIRNISYNYHDPNGWSPWLSMKEGTDGPANAVIKVGDDVYVGGNFSNAGQSGDPVIASNIARWNSTYHYWRPLLSATVLGSVRTLIHFNDHVYAAGPMTYKENPQQILDPDNHLAWLGSRGWHLVPGIVRGNIMAATSSGSQVIVAGNFFSADEQIAVNIATWDSATKDWKPITPGSGLADQEDLAYVLALAADDDFIYAGGLFGVVDTFETPHIARMNRRTGVWEAMGDGLDQTVRAIAISDDGTVYAGGDFSHSGTTPIRGIARWNGSAWEPLGDGIDGDIRSLAAADGKLYVGGSFRRAGDKEVNNIAVWDQASQEWSGMGDGLDSRLLPSVDVLAYHKQSGRLFAGGFFNVSGSDSMYNVARWNRYGWSGLGSGTDWAVWSVLLEGHDLYVAGGFRTAGGKTSPYIGLWHDPTLSVEERPEPAVAGELRGGWPNPFASATTIIYDLPRRTHVQLGIYDVRGIELERLVDGDEESGEHRIEWLPGASLPSGVYVVRMEVEGQVLAEKIIRR